MDKQKIEKLIQNYTNNITFNNSQIASDMLQFTKDLFALIDNIPLDAEGELLPCPFCGSNDIHNSPAYSSVRYCYCQGCGAKAGNNNWNKRAER